jgi:hypothetical protein
MIYLSFEGILPIRMAYLTFIGGNAVPHGDLISNPRPWPSLGLSLHANGMGYHPAGRPKLYRDASRARGPAPAAGRHPPRAGGETLPDLQ